MVKLGRGGGELLRERQHRALERRERRVQVKNGTHVVFRLVHDLFVVSVAEERERHAVAAERRLDDVRHIVLVRFLVEVRKILAGRLLMALEIVVRAVGNAPQLAPVGEREGIFDVSRGAGVERELRRLVVAQPEMLFLDAETQQPVLAVVFPVGKPFKVRAGLAEEFALHLLKLARAEREVARRDLVAERLADLADAERELPARRALDVREVDENALRGLRAEIAGRGRVLGNADGGFEHEVELADGRKVVLAAHRADDVLVLGDKSVHLLKGHGVHVDLVVLLADELVGAVTRAAGLAVEQRVGKARNVAGRDPRLRVHDDGGVETDVIGALLHELLEPRLLDVVLELHAERTVVPGVGKAAVNFASGVDKAAVLAERYDLVHGFLVMIHISFLSPAAGCRRIK